MPQVLNITATPEEAADEIFVRRHIRKLLGPQWNGSYIVDKRSIDSRQKQVKVLLRLTAYGEKEIVPPLITSRRFNPLSPEAQKVVIIGLGPAGLFAALRLIENGIRPVIIERGKDVQARRRDLAALHREHTVNPDSNYCFGEGGAGTYSDGKLYTRASKRGNVRSVLETFVQFGSSENILADAHPHIGTNKLPGIIAAMRKIILECGGEIHFNTRFTGFIMNENSNTRELKGIRTRQTGTNDEQQMSCDRVILATGHSARDVFRVLFEEEIEIEFKPFALGVRVEHPQVLIDRVQYHCDTRNELLPPAAYNFAEQVQGKGVYSFCMCPGGIIAPCATEQDEVVTNGWSPSKRNNPTANSGVVVQVEWADIPEFHQYGALAGMFFQRKIEHDCWEAAGKTQAVPAQRLVDFVNGKLSADLPQCSYQPGVVSQRLDRLLPEFISAPLRAGFKEFGKKMKGYLTNDAIVVAPESRTSSPVRIPRDPESLQHPVVRGLYPCGEGAGYAGGIISAALDGELVATEIIRTMGGTSESVKNQAGNLEDY